VKCKKKKKFCAYLVNAGDLYLKNEFLEGVGGLAKNAGFAACNSRQATFGGLGSVDLACTC
jgi:hypothetical protein